MIRRIKPLFVCALASLAFTGCAPFNYTGADAPEAQVRVEPFAPRPKVALVLGAGGPRGYAHIGVMRVLEAAGIKYDLIVGSSVGSLLGVFWASGLSAEEIDRLSNQGGPLTLFDPSPFADRGWIHGQKLQDYVNDQVQQRSLQELPRRVIVVATHRDEKTPRFFTRGNSGVAVRASSAMPGIISPVGILGEEYEDADVTLPLAVAAARDAGADFIIAVNVYPHLESAPESASLRSRSESERRARLIDAQTAHADFVIHPNTPFNASPRKKFFAAAREIGETQALAQLPALQAALAQHFLEDK
ncbi:MAG: patatin-like phospholipase family protein [Pseudomonadota bacterium]